MNQPNKKERAKTHAEKMKRDRDEEARQDQRLKTYNRSLGVFEKEQAGFKNRPNYWESPQKYL